MVNEQSHKIFLYADAKIRYNDCTFFKGGAARAGYEEDEGRDDSHFV